MVCSQERGAASSAYRGPGKGIHGVGGAPRARPGQAGRFDWKVQFAVVVVMVKVAGQARKVGGGPRVSNFRRSAGQASTGAPCSNHGLSEKIKENFPGFCPPWR